jgi:hypothetical protein
VGLKESHISQHEFIKILVGLKIDLSSNNLYGNQGNVIMEREFVLFRRKTGKEKMN